MEPYDLTDSGEHIKLTKSEYQKLKGEADSASRLRREVEVWKNLAQSAMGNINAIIRRADSELAKWLQDDESTIQNAD